MISNSLFIVLFFFLHFNIRRKWEKQNKEEGNIHFFIAGSLILIIVCTWWWGWWWSKWSKNNFVIHFLSLSLLFPFLIMIAPSFLSSNIFSLFHPSTCYTFNRFAGKIRNLNFFSPGTYLESGWRQERRVSPTESDDDGNKYDDEDGERRGWKEWWRNLEERKWAWISFFLSLFLSSHSFLIQSGHMFYLLTWNATVSFVVQWEKRENNFLSSSPSSPSS